MIERMDRTREGLIGFFEGDLEARVSGNKDVTSRLSRFRDWLWANNLPWHNPDLAAYRDFLLSDGKARSSVAAHLGSIRGAYSDLVGSNLLREWLYGLCDPTDPPERQKAQVDELITRLSNAIHPSAAEVRIEVQQDRPDSQQHRLTPGQAEKLQRLPGYKTLRGYRDSAIIALLLSTGIREAELCALDVEDLRQRLQSDLALWVRNGKGLKSRLVPYGDLSDCLIVVDAWLREAGIDTGAVFRGLTRNGREVKTTRLTPRAVQYVLHDYPIVIDGQEVEVTVHDLRRTYAALQYAGGMAIKAIQENLGHSKMQTTLEYIGPLDVVERRAKAVLHFDLTIPNRQVSLLESETASRQVGLECSSTQV